jgi:hypothetical protein
MNGWPRTLTWGDFRAIPNPGPRDLLALNGHPIVAKVAIDIMFYPGSSSAMSAGGQWFFFAADVRVILNMSQMQYVPSRIPRGQEPYYLRHEQGHMDLMGLFARELEANLVTLRAPTQSSLLQQANTATDVGIQNARNYAINTPGHDCLYDVDTNHGMIPHQQTRWNGLIASNIARWRQPNFIFRT